MSEQKWFDSTTTGADTSADAMVTAGNIIYVSIDPVSLVRCELIKKIPIHHGPVKNRGKGKVNRDWEK